MQELVGCPLEADALSPPADCLGWQRWQAAEAAWVARDEAAVVRLLAHRAPQVRYGAASALVGHGVRYGVELVLAEQLVSQAEVEAHPGVGGLLAQLLVKLDQPTLVGRISPLFRHANRELRSGLLAHGSLVPGGSAILASLFDDAEVADQALIVEGLWLAEDSHACPVFERALQGSSFQVADRVAYGVAFGGRCLALVGAVLKWSAQVTDAPSGAVVSRALGELCSAQAVTRAERIQALNQARRLSARGAPDVRAGALEAVTRCDTKTGAHFVRGFLNDPAPLVRERAAQLLRTAQ